MRQKQFPRLYSDAWLKELKAAIKHPKFNFKPSKYTPDYSNLTPKQADNLRSARILLGCIDNDKIELVSDQS